MNWYYIENGNRKGPFSESDFRQLVDNATIKADTLVWRDGLKDWAVCSSMPEFSQVMPPTIGNVRCQVCWNEFPKTNTIILDGTVVCFNCKPRHIQMMNEGIAGTTTTIARKKKLLVMGKDARLPDKCIKCNAPANGLRLKRDLYWHPSAIYLLIILSILIYAIVAIIVRKRAKIEIGLCPTHARKRKICIALAWFSWLGMLGLFIAAAGLGSGALAAVGCLMFIAAIVVSCMTSPVAARKIDKNYVWISGVCGEYLADLPEWTG